MKKDIVLVEDDLMLGQVLTDFLQCNNLSVSWAKDGVTGLKYFNELHPKLLILDVMLPDINGLELLDEVRKNNSSVPVIIMTGTEFSIQSQVKAYKLGAINYLKKPVIPEVLLAQINHLIPANEIKRFRCGSKTISIDKQLLTVNNSSLKLREKEAQLLIFLLENEDRLVSRNEIMNYLWGDDHPKRNAQLNSTVFRLKNELALIPDISINVIYGTGFSVVVG